MPNYNIGIAYTRYYETLEGARASAAEQQPYHLARIQQEDGHYKVAYTPRQDWCPCLSVCTCDERNHIRLFQGGHTRQVDGVGGKPAQETAWYWEPDDYAGDVLWSQPYPTRDAALAAAIQGDDHAND